MAAWPEDEPFSPSDFLNLSPTPRPEGDGDGDGLAMQDDALLLPFITRVLMEEEDIDDNPDHPALLEAQQPFADILSDAAASSTNKSSAFDSPAFAANATWPYDPVELSHQLLTHPDMGVIGLHGGTEDDSLASTLFGGCNRVTMDMLNQAFLKGMEEANKFLPTTTTNSLSDLEDTSVDHLRRDNNGRGRKNRHNNDWDSLEDEIGRSCKLMLPEAEEANETVDKFILNGYQSLFERMMNLSISVDIEAEKKIMKEKGSTNEAVDLRTLLIHCAQAVATGDRLNATELLLKIKQRSSPRGDATQRLAHCFSEGLEARLAGTGSQVYKSLMSRRTPAVELHKAYQLYMRVCCTTMIAFRFSNRTILKATAGRKKVHIVDYSDHYGFQWPILLGCLATNCEGGPPEVKITVISLPQPGFRPGARIEQTGRRLSNFARRCGVPFKFHSIVAKWETVCVDDLDTEPDELLIVNSLFHFEKLMDEGDDIDSPSPRDMVLSNIQKMRPDLFILCTENSSYNAPFFVTRFREALFYYSAMFDMMDTTASRDSEERILVERDLLGRCALNVIACEGPDRVKRPETYKQWTARIARAGLRQLPLDPEVVTVVRKNLKDGYHRDFVIDVDQQWLLQGWKGRILYAMSTWVVNGATT